MSRFAYSDEERCQQLRRETIFTCPYLSLHRDRVRLPNGAIIEDFYLVDYPCDAVGILASNPRGQLILCRVPRYSTNTHEWEIPAGGLEAGETPLQAAERELREETGYSCKDLRLIYSYYPQSGSSNKVFHLVACKTLEKLNEPDENEISATAWFEIAELRDALQQNAFHNGLTLSGVLLWLSGAQADGRSD